MNVNVHVGEKLSATCGLNGESGFGLLDLPVSAVLPTPTTSSIS